MIFVSNVLGICLCIKYILNWLQFKHNMIPYNRIMGKSYTTPSQTFLVFFFSISLVK